MTWTVRVVNATVAAGLGLMLAAGCSDNPATKYCNEVKDKMLDICNGIYPDHEMEYFFLNCPRYFEDSRCGRLVQNIIACGLESTSRDCSSSNPCAVTWEALDDNDYCEDLLYTPPSFFGGGGSSGGDGVPDETSNCTGSSCCYDVEDKMLLYCDGTYPTTDHADFFRNCTDYYYDSDCGDLVQSFIDCALADTSGECSEANPCTYYWVAMYEDSYCEAVLFSEY